MSGPFHHSSRRARAAARLLTVAALPWLAALGCGTTAAPPRPRSAVPGAVPFKPVTLSNDVFPSGMRLVVREDTRARAETLYVSYRVGATDEPAGKEGLAELAARLTLQARHGGASTPTLEERLTAAGVTPRNTITYDDTELWLSLAPDLLARVARLEAQRMADPLAHVTEEDFRKVRAQQIDELWVSQESMDKGPSRRWLHEKLLAGHVYGRPVQGTPESLDRITLDDVRAFVKANYTPAHAVLVVSGPLSIADAKFEVAKAFGGLTGAGTATRTAPVQRTPPPEPEAPPGGAPLVAVHGAVKAPQLHFLLTVPGRYSGKYAEGLVAQQTLQQWMRDYLGRKDLPFGNTFTATYQELDGLTVLSCFIPLKPHVQEEEARKLATQMLGTLEASSAQMLEGMEDSGLGPSTAFQLAQGAPLPFRRGATPSGVRDVLGQALYEQAHTLSGMNLARVVRATGRVDIGRLREEQVAQALAQDVLSSYLRQYLRPERVRTLLILP